MNSILPLSSVLSFLMENGWRKTSEIRGAFQIWHSDEFPSSEVTLPLSENHKRYELLLQDTLKELSEYLVINESSLVNQISPQNFDAITVRAIGKDVEYGSIPFDDGLKLLTASHKLLKGCSRRLRKFKNKNKHLSSYFNHIGMGQTQIGSYIISINSPLYRVDMNDEPELFESKVSLGRMINKSFYSKIYKLSKIVNDNTNSEKMIEELLDIGIDKKDCDSLIDIFGNQSHRDVEININWSPKESIEERYLNAIQLYSRNVKKIVEFRDALKRIKVEKNIQLSGEIENLHRGYDEELGKAKLRTKYQGKEISVSFTINEEEYTSIANAHVNKKIVTLTGELEVIKIEQRITANFRSLVKVSVCENLEIDFVQSNLKPESSNKSGQVDS